MVNKILGVIGLKKNNGQAVVGIILIIIVLIALVIVVYLMFKDNKSDIVCSTDQCCVGQGLGDFFDTRINACTFIPGGNPTILPLVKVTDSSGQIINPPNGQDALIMPNTTNNTGG